MHNPRRKLKVSPNVQFSCLVTLHSYFNLYYLMLLYVGMLRLCLYFPAGRKTGIYNQTKKPLKLKRMNTEHAASSVKLNCTYLKGNILCKLYKKEVFVEFHLFKLNRQILNMSICQVFPFVFNGTCLVILPSISFCCSVVLA